MKKKFSLWFCVCAMLVSVIPQSVSAEKTARASVMFASDYQFVSSRTPDLYGDSTITSCWPIVERFSKDIAEDNHDVETIVLGGDYTQNDGNRNPEYELDRLIFGDNVQYHYGNNATYSINEIKSATGRHIKDANYLFVQGNHDPDIGAPGGELLSESGPYEFDEYIVYLLNDQDYVGVRPRTSVGSYNNIVPGTIKQISNAEEVVKVTAEKLSNYLNGLIEAGDSRPVFVCSHQALHYTESNYNGKAHYIFDAVNEAAKELDIIYFFAHAHEQCDELGGGLSYIESGESIKVCDDTKVNGGSVKQTVNFTYMNYGFLAWYDGVNPYISASVIDIRDDELIINRFTSKIGIIKRSVGRKNIAEIKEESYMKFKIGVAAYELNGEVIENDVAPLILNDRTMMPIRVVAENIGAEVSWNGEEKSTTLTLGEKEIKLVIDSDEAYVNGTPSKIDSPAVIISERTYLPIRFIIENFEVPIEWDGNEKTVTITY